MGYSVFMDRVSMVSVAAPRRFVKELRGRTARGVLASSALALSVVLPVSALAQSACPPAPGELCDLGTLRPDNTGLNETASR